MKNLSYIFLSLAIIVFPSCKQEKTAEVAATNTALSAYQESPSPETAIKALDEIRSSIRANKNQDVKNLLKQGYSISKEQKILSQSISFLMPILRIDTATDSRQGYLADLVQLISQTGRETPTQVLAHGYTNTYSDDSEVTKLIADMVKDKTTSEEAILTVVAKSSLADITKGLNKEDAQAYVDGCEAFALAHPTSEKTPDYLLKGGEMASALGTYGKTLELYDWIVEDYPKSPHAPMTLFMKGFLFDNELKDYDNAKVTYEDFLQKYPDHHLVSDVKFLLDNLGKSEEELRAMLQNAEAAQSK